MHPGRDALDRLASPARDGVEAIAVGLCDQTGRSLGYQSRCIGTARRASDKVGGVVKEVDGECRFSRQLAVVTGGAITPYEHQFGIGFANPADGRRLTATGQRGHTGQDTGSASESAEVRTGSRPGKAV